MVVFVFCLGRADSNGKLKFTEVRTFYIWTFLVIFRTFYDIIVGMNIEHLFDGIDDKFRLNDIASGDIVPFRNQYYLMDPENFHFDQIDARESKIDKQQVQKFLDDKKIAIPVDDFIVLWNFQAWVKMTYPDHRHYEAMRGATMQMLKNSPTNPLPLSEAFNRKIVMCTEMSALAQMYLQHKGIKSFLYNGNAITNSKQNIQLGGAGHAWLMIVINGKKYFYDPVNPMITTNNIVLPAIMDYSGISKTALQDFEEIIHKSSKQGGGFAYLEAKDIYGVGRRWLYGFEHGIDRVRTERAVKRLYYNQTQKNSGYEI